MTSHLQVLFWYSNYQWCASTMEVYRLEGFSVPRFLGRVLSFNACSSWPRQVEAVANHSSSSLKPVKRVQVARFFGSQPSSSLAF